jgi:hypothetical protein
MQIEESFRDVKSHQLIVEHNKLNNVMAKCVNIDFAIQEERNRDW